MGVLLTSSGDNRNPANFEVLTLSEEEAMHLFKKSAGDCCNAPDIVAIAEQVVKECGGIPIAIVTVGNALRAAGSNESEWRDALRQLKNGKHGERVENCIKLSYNYLKCEEQKGFFLLCCLFPEDADIPIETLLRYGMGIGLLKDDNYTIQDARDRVHTLVGQLRRLFLLLESGKPQHVRMHDVVRDVVKMQGIESIRCHVVAEENLCDLLELSPSLSRLQSLEVSGCHSLKYVFPLSIATKLLQLKSLKVGDCSRIEEVFHMESRRRWEGEGAGTTTIKLPQLTHLELSYLPKLTALSKSTVAFELPQLMTLEIEDLDSLKSVFTSTLQSSNTKPIGSLFTLVPTDDWTKQFPNLQILNIGWCPEVEVLFEFETLENASNSFLSQLQELVLNYMPKLKHVWKNGAQARQCFQNLQILKEDFLENMEHIIGGEGEEEDKEGDVTVLFPQLAQLHLEGLENLITFFSEDKYTLHWKSLEELKLVECPKMKTFRSSENVNDTSHHEQYYLFNEDVAEVKLRKFNIRNIGCEMIWHCNTQVSVEHLFVSKCHKLKNVFAYSSGDGIKMVENLEVYNCESLNCIWNISCGDPHDLTKQLEAAFTQQLKKLCIVECPSLHRVFSFSSTARSVVVFPKLYDLSIIGCSMMEEIFGNDDEATTSRPLLPNLGSLKLRDNANLKSIFKGVDAENATEFSLQEIIITGCPKLEPSSLYFSLLNKSELRSVEIAFENQQVIRVETNTYSNSMLIDGLENKLMDMVVWDGKSTPPGYFSGMRDVELKNLINFPAAAWWHFLQSLPNLSKLKISSCGSTEVIFRLEEGLNAKKLPQLTELRLSCLEKLTCIWVKGIPTLLSQRFQNLQELHVEECHNLRNVLTLSMVKHLPNLTTLKVTNCSMVEEICFNESKAVEEGVEISNETIEFPRVETLILRNLPKLTSFCAAQVCAFKWPSLTEVVVYGCPGLQTFTWAVSNTPKLKEVYTLNKTYPLMEDLNATTQLIFNEKGEE